MMTEKRLVIVSNRLPIQLKEKNGKVTPKESDGGLVSSLKSYLERVTGDALFSKTYWFGAADFPESRWKKFKSANKESFAFSIEPIFIEKKKFNQFYNGFCNATLWPLFHYFLSYVEFDESTFQSYEEVNSRFSERLLEFLQPGDTLWIHDYQLMLLPELIREKQPEITIGFFLHIPFPSYELFRLLHRRWKEKIISGLLGADLIGFHTHEYVQHFLKSVRMVAGLNHQYRSIPHKGRTVKAELFPLGIDFDKFNKANGAEIEEQKTIIRNNFNDRKIIFSVDRLDYTKGVTHRLSGLERFLELFPEWNERFVFILVVVPSRQIVSKYNERRKLIEGQVGRINGKYSSLQWQPIIYRYNSLSFHELSALYQTADIALITPLRDGMNLVAKEFVASRVKQDGVLILSELAGAANEMGEALLVNPMDTEEVAQAIATGLSLTVPEQKQSMALMQKRLIEYDVLHWVDDFFRQLSEVKALQKSQENRYVTRDVMKSIRHDFDTAKKRLLFFDYDGTLVPFVSHPRHSSPGKELLQLLETLSNDKRNEIVIISGRDFQDLEKYFEGLRLHLISEHGASTRLNGAGWVHEGRADQQWKELIRPMLELSAKRSPGSFVEEKNHSIAWHYRAVNPELGFIRSRELLDHLFHLANNEHLNVIDGNKVIEVRVAGIDKGTASKKLLDVFPFDFNLAIGDDQTDEDMFKALNGKAITIRVGDDVTAAKYSLPSQQGVIKFLQQLTT
ncbi:MAG TPA: bifunctional alpha,alpha-trehalose-phosphate synthase (UDP-forming)/trehalose-phosphatase [Cyclobacteriaceae bacterium]|jgi:trehalose 6-phosphate synthase/phosphatase|nr:bifunctional alpha,alpha-trehalose-phosphate synthase (UDP-forming)/trehalose-phosphatase [Cyclobacteriaceae bacterium]